MQKATKRKSHAKGAAFFNQSLLDLVDLQSACYGVNLHGVNNVTVINCELNNQFLTLQAQ